MAKTLVVNCYVDSTRINELKAAIGKFSSTIVVHYNQIQANTSTDGYEAVIISGSEVRITKPEDKAKYQAVSAFIENCKLPLMGICFGHQLLCSTYGAKTGTLPSPVIDQFEQVNVLQTGEIFSRFKASQTIPLAEYHNDYVLKDSLEAADFKLLADSASCEVEAVRHRTKLFYGVQFHPERITLNDETHPEGLKVIENFYVHMVKRFGV